MEISQLRYFLSASKHLNFTTAAQECYTSRQNMARSVRALESEVGAIFFLRTKSGMTLTPEGEEAARRVQGIIGEIDALGSAFNTMGTGDVLEVAFANSFLTYVPNQVAERLYDYDEYPLRISEYNYDACHSRIASGNSDVAVVFGLQCEVSDCEKVLLHQSPLYAMVASTSNAVSKGSFELKDLTGKKVLLLSESPTQYRPLLQACHGLGLADGDIEIITSINAAKQMIVRQNAVAIASKGLDLQHDDDIALLPFANKHFRWQVHALHRHDSGAKSQAVQSYIGYLRDVFQIIDE